MAKTPRPDRQPPTTPSPELEGSSPAAPKVPRVRRPRVTTPPSDAASADAPSPASSEAPTVTPTAAADTPLRARASKTKPATPGRTPAPAPRRPAKASATTPSTGEAQPQPPARKAPARRAPTRRTNTTPVTAAVEAPIEVPTETTLRAAQTPLHVLMVASESAPFSKTGGLGDVIAALPRAIASLGHQVTVVVPRHRGIEVSGAPADRFDVEMGGHHYEAAAYVEDGRTEGQASSVRVVLIDHPAFFDRDGVYGIGSQDYEDNPRRFAFFSLAALEYARRAGTPVDIVHAHDWPTGLTPLYLRTRYQGDEVLGRAASVFTVHNVAYKGLCAAGWLPQLGLGWDVFTSEGLEYWLHASFLKAGIVYSDVVTTVSQRYAQELQQPETAFGFEGVIRARRDHLLGIRNGIDVEAWNPSADPYLPAPFDASNLEGKRQARARLLETFGLADVAVDGRPRPVVAMVSRMVDQKGLDLIADIADQLPSLGAAFVVMGTGEPWYEEMWRSLARQYPEQVGVRVGFDEGLSHLIEGGADLFMMPSRYEPCGLNQMYSLRYGTVPVVRATGGLADTVVDVESSGAGGNGFTFTDASGQALLDALRRALAFYRRDPEGWAALQRVGMARDFSWQASARAYLEAYAQARGSRPARDTAAVAV